MFESNSLEKKEAKVKTFATNPQISENAINQRKIRVIIISIVTHQIKPVINRKKATNSMTNAKTSLIFSPVEPPIERSRAIAYSLGDIDRLQNLRKKLADESQPSSGSIGALQGLRRGSVEKFRFGACRGLDALFIKTNSISKCPKAPQHYAVVSFQLTGLGNIRIPKSFWGRIGASNFSNFESLKIRNFETLKLWKLEHLTRLKS